mmetsp:Transcript_50108/g.119192  ORF Transcript_50108/g.119192 Transcript_50108/m.119192 type:complete len:308 (+) Transcript_50108:605-1528(+)
MERPWDDVRDALGGKRLDLAGGRGVDVERVFGVCGEVVVLRDFARKRYVAPGERRVPAALLDKGRDAPLLGRRQALHALHALGCGDVRVEAPLVAADRRVLSDPEEAVASEAPGIHSLWRPGPSRQAERVVRPRIHPDDVDALERGDLPWLGLVPRELVPLAFDVRLLERQGLHLLISEPQPPVAAEAPREDGALVVACEGMLQPARHVLHLGAREVDGHRVGVVCVVPVVKVKRHAGGRWDSEASVPGAAPHEQLAVLGRARGVSLPRRHLGCVARADSHRQEDEPRLIVPDAAAVREVRDLKREP